MKTKEQLKRSCYVAPAFFDALVDGRVGRLRCVHEFCGAPDDGGDEVDPVLREVFAAASVGVAITPLACWSVNGLIREFARPTTGIIGLRRNDVEPVDQTGIDLRVKLLPEVVASDSTMLVRLVPRLGLGMREN